MLIELDRGEEDTVFDCDVCSSADWRDVVAMREGDNRVGEEPIELPWCLYDVAHAVFGGRAGDDCDLSVVGLSGLDCELAQDGIVLAH